MSSQDAKKRSGSKQSHRHRHHHRRRRRLNADLFDDDDDDKRDDWAKTPLSPDSLWKELQHQKYLRSRMRRNVQAKAQVVDGNGKVVTLAERIIRYKLYNTPSEPPGEEPSTSKDPELTKEKESNLLDLLQQYVQQRQSEEECSSQLLEQITETKVALNENEYKRAVSSRRELRSTSSISLGDSATNYNAKKVGALQKTLGNGVELIDDKPSQREGKEESVKNGSNVNVENCSVVEDSVSEASRIKNNNNCNDNLENDGDRTEGCEEKPKDEENSLSSQKDEVLSLLQKDEDGFCKKDEEVNTNSPKDEEVNRTSQKDEEVNTNSPKDKEVNRTSQKDEEVNITSPKDEEVNINYPKDNDVNITPPNDNEVNITSPNDNEVNVTSPKDNEVNTARILDVRNSNDKMDDANWMLIGNSKNKRTDDMNKNGDKNNNKEDTASVNKDTFNDDKDTTNITCHKDNIGDNSNKAVSNSDPKIVTEIDVPCSQSDHNNQHSFGEKEHLKDSGTSVDMESNHCDTGKESRVNEVKSDIGNDRSLNTVTDNESVSERTIQTKQYGRSEQLQDEKENNDNMENGRSFVDDKKSEKDSAIENSFDADQSIDDDDDDDDDDDNDNDAENEDDAYSKANRAYHFSAFNLERSYSLPELVPVNSRGIFTGHSDLANRKRGKRLTLISTHKGSNTTVTSHLLPSLTSNNWLPLPTIKAGGKKKNKSSNGSSVTPGAQDTTSSCPNLDEYDGRNQYSNLDSYAFSTDEDVDGYSGYYYTQETSSNHSVKQALPPISNESPGVGDMKSVSWCMFSPDCKRRNAQFISQEIPDREKRVIGLYNELKCYSMMDRGQPSISIAMTSRPNGLHDVHIQWGTGEQEVQYDSRAYRQFQAAKNSKKVTSKQTELPPLQKTYRNPVNYNAVSNNSDSRKKPGEFIYLRDLSFSHYVAKAVYENKLHKYMGDVGNRESNVLKKRPRQPIEFEERIYNQKYVNSNVDHSIKSWTGMTKSWAGSTQKLLLPKIKARHVMCFSSFTTPGLKGRQPTQKANNQMKENTRGKQQAFSKLRKRLKLPPLNP